jgi:YlmC/YmxH family sporulation protein
MRICDLRQKEVINMCSCERLGCVADIDIDCKTGQVLSIIIPGPCKFCGILGRDKEFVIPFNCICQIGSDIILVRVDIEEVLQKCRYIS